MSSGMIGAVRLAIAMIIFLVNALRVKVNPREPRAVHPTIPVFRRLLRMLTEGPLYFKRVRYGMHLLSPVAKLNPLHLR
jgi:hypothetical protein